MNPRLQGNGETAYRGRNRQQRGQERESRGSEIDESKRDGLLEKRRKDSGSADIVGYPEQGLEVGQCEACLLCFGEQARLSYFREQLGVGYLVKCSLSAHLQLLKMPSGGKQHYNSNPQTQKT